MNDYLRDTYYSRLGITGREVDQLNVAACRLMLDVMPGLETSVVFQVRLDVLVLELFFVPILVIVKTYVHVICEKIALMYSY